MGDASRCGSCGETIASADAWLNRQGTVVCRRCYYAEQTILQDQRVKESEQELGIHGTYVLGKRLLVGGLLLLVGGAGTLGALREGAWRSAVWPALSTLLGGAVVWVALRGARQSQD